jgi:hypothetical protein
MDKMKKITPAKLVEFVTNKQIISAKLDLKLLLSKIHRFYCEPLNNMGLCPIDCANCKDKLHKAVIQLNPRETRDIYHDVASNLLMARKLMSDEKMRHFVI